MLYHVSPVAPFFPYDPCVKTGCDHNCKACSSPDRRFQPVDKYPAGGYMNASNFMLVNGVPYICDDTQDMWGTMVRISENVFTRFTRREDASCINLAASIDMTENDYTNTVLNHYLEQIIGNQYETLDSLLNIMKSTVTFRLSFHVENEAGGVVYENYGLVRCESRKIHTTEVPDRYISSFKNLYNINIPAMDYDGLYTLVLDKLEAEVDYIATKEHVIDGLNPFYEFVKNNTAIALQHDTIKAETSDGAVTIASIDLDNRFPFQANLTTRLRLSFIAYMTNSIVTFDTFQVWKALFQPNEAIIDDLRNKITTLQEDVTENTSDIEDLGTKVTELEKKKVSTYAQGAEYYTGELVYLVAGALYQAANDFTSDADTTKTPAESMLVDIANGNLIPVSEK